MKISTVAIKRIIRLTLHEDIGQGDVTTDILIPQGHHCAGYIVCRQQAIISGLNIAAEVFHQADKTIRFHPLVRDGQPVKPNTRLAQLKGRTRGILKAERVALNFLSHLSAIATQTRTFVKAVFPYKVQIMDTRKTTPGLRLLERLAVRNGGGGNHRFNLDDMVLIKDNHITTARGKMSIQDMVRICRRRTRKAIEIEVDTFSQFEKALSAQPDFILLDNMSPKQIQKAVKLRNKYPVRKKIQLEASGGINIENVRRYARTGVERISIGALTHSKKAVDVSLELA